VLAILLVVAGAVLIGLLTREIGAGKSLVTQMTPTVAPERKPMPQVESEWQQQRVLPAPAQDKWAPGQQENSRRTEVMRKPQSAVPAPPQAPPVPFAYVGKGRDARGRFAVLSRDERIYMVRTADVVEGAYRVESIGEDRILLTYLALGTPETLLFSGSGGRNASVTDPLSSVAESPEATLLVTGPRQAAIGEEFTLMVGLEAGGVGVLQDGNVELYYDTKVLRRSIADAAQSTDSGRARVDISGSYIGHSAPTPVQFRVVATAPTTTEIRIVPLNVADTEGRNVAVSGPEGYRLTVVAGPAK
jgi:hypothetical protein